jgi:aryl-alcohol dehydrogenase-like predicted oxidoreductase
LSQQLNLRTSNFHFDAQARTTHRAESVLGDVIAHEGLREKLFIATKLEAPDAAELKRSLSRLKTAKLDLLQLHNVRNPRQ